MSRLGRLRHAFLVEQHRQDESDQYQDGQSHQIGRDGHGRHDIGLPGLGDHGLGTAGVVVVVFIEHEVMQPHR